MKPIAVIAIFDIGKTNKKLLLFDADYRVVMEESTQLPETTDEDGFPCEDINALTKWVNVSFDRVKRDKRFTIKALNFSAYGASLVYLDKGSNVIAPLYNYLKPLAAAIQSQFYDKYGGETMLAKETASPVLGNLNSGMQLYRLKYEKPRIFSDTRWAVHLPQYLSFIFCRAINSDITSIGCHTNLWDFQQNRYHNWVFEEGIGERLPPVVGSTSVAGYTEERIPVGPGLHDSSAALIPYLSSFNEPFVLLSTGTWCISLNPFNHSPLSSQELKHDCLCYLAYDGKPVKASRLFAGHEHEQQVKRLADNFGQPTDYYLKLSFDPAILKRLGASIKEQPVKRDQAMAGSSLFASRDLAGFTSYEEAYHQLMIDIIGQQVSSTNLVLKGTSVSRIFVDGGFGKNAVYMHLLAKAYPSKEIYAASVAQASALGAALCMHSHWNQKPLPAGLIEIRSFSGHPGAVGNT